MSFPIIIFKLFSIYKQTQMRRKEKGSSLTQNKDQTHSPTRERTSSFTSNGSITLEAAFSVSLFFFAALCMTNMLEIMSIQTSLKNALHAVGKEYAADAYIRPYLSTEELEKKIIAHIGEERLERSLIANGSKGLELSESKFQWNTAILDLCVKYRLEIPIPFFAIQMPWQKQSVRVKGWTGYEGGVWDTDSSQIVYVTDYGVVYHADRSCTYLDLSVRAVEWEQVTEMRNQSGNKYKACSRCVKMSDDNKVYVTDYGERYHGSLECSGLKRNVYEVALSDVYGLGGCSKCVE